MRLAEDYLQEALRFADDERGKRDRAKELFVEGESAGRKGDADRARTLFRGSLRIDREPSNPAREAFEGIQESAP